MFHTRMPKPGEPVQTFRDRPQNEFVQSRLRNFREVAPNVFVRVRKPKP